MSYELIQDLCESRLIRTKQGFKRYNAKEISELAFLYFISVLILANEFEYLPEAKSYAKSTFLYGNFDRFRYNGTDLYMLLHVLVGKNREEAVETLRGGKEENELFLQNISPRELEIRRFFLYLKKGQVDDNYNRRFMLRLQMDLDISVSNYKSIRILVADWKNLTDVRKKLVMTRLLQAFRVRAPRAEIRKYLEEISKRKNLEISGVDNAETGKQGTGVRDPEMKRSSKEGKVPWWMKAAAIGAAGYAGYRMVRSKK